MPIAVLAGRLLPFATDQSLFDTLAEQSTPAAVQAERAARRAAARAVNAETEKTPLEQAETAGDDTDLIESLAQKASRPVARVLVVNPATPVAVLERLTARAACGSDIETLQLLTKSALPASQILELIARHQKNLQRTTGFDKLVGAVRDRLAADADPTAYEQAARSGPAYLCEALARSMSNAKSCVSTDEFVSWTSEANMPVVLQALVSTWSSAALLTDYVVERLVEHAASFDLRLSSGHAMSTTAALALISSGNPQLVNLVLLSLTELSDQTVAALLPHVAALASNAGDVHVLADGRMVPHLSQDKLASLVAGTLRSSPDHERSRAFRHVCGHTPEGVWLPLLRSCPSSTVGRWLAGENAAAPSASAVAALAADPGSTLDRAGAGLSAKYLRLWESVEGEADYIGRFWQIFTAESLDRPGVCDVLDLAGPTVVERAQQPRDGSVFATYLGRRLSERFGERPDCWQLALKLISSGDISRATVTGFLDVVEGISSAAAPNAS